MAKIANGGWLELRCTLDQAPYCCGHALISDITTNGRGGYVDGKWVTPGYETQEERNQAFLKLIDEQLENEVEAWNEDRYEEDDHLENVFAFMTMTLIEDQVPGDLLGFLKKQGWEVLQTGTNPKTGNTIYNIGKNL